MVNKYIRDVKPPHIYSHFGNYPGGGHLSWGASVLGGAFVPGGRCLGGICPPTLHNRSMLPEPALASAWPWARFAMGTTSLPPFRPPLKLPYILYPFLSPSLSLLLVVHFPLLPPPSLPLLYTTITARRYSQRRKI